MKISAPRRCLFVLFALLCTSAALAAPLHPLKSNPRYFTDGSGRAIFLTGSHTWANFATDQGNTEFDFEGYLDFLTAHHHNFFRAWMWDLPHSRQGFNGGPFNWKPMPWRRTGPGLATDGQPKFDLTQWDETYFARVRARAIQARDRGMYVSILLFQGYAWQFDRTDTDGFPLDGRNNVNGVDAGHADGAATLDQPATTAAQEAYVRKVIDTVNDLDNVLYEISNESGPASTPWQYHMINVVHGYERTKPKQHPVGMTYQYKDGKNSDLYASPADWISPNCEPELVLSPTAADGGKVIIYDTDHGYGWQDLKRDGPALHQVWAWKCFLRGNNTLFMDPYLAKSTAGNSTRNQPLGINPREPYFGLTPDPYYESLRVAMGRTRAWADKIDLARMPPRGDLASTSYCLARPGREYLVYQPGPERAFTVTLERGRYDYKWFNPTTGLVVGTGRLEAKAGSRPFSAPFGGDAVLHLRRPD